MSLAPFIRGFPEFVLRAASGKKNLIGWLSVRASGGSWPHKTSSIFKPSREYRPVWGGASGISIWRHYETQLSRPAAYAGQAVSR